LIGFLILTCGAGAGTYGQLTVASGVAGVLSALLPLFAACIGYILFREKLPRPATVGLVVGFAGVGILLRPGSGFDVLAWASSSWVSWRGPSVRNSPLAPACPMTLGLLLAWNCWPVARRCL
jgi:drug/metabolite transporter (DMT)-like permease